MVDLNNAPDAKVELSLEDSLGAAFDKIESEGPAPRQARMPTPRAPVPSETSGDAAAHARDEQGRFAAKEAKDASDAAQNSTAPDATGSETGIAVTRKPPASMSPELQSHWETFDPAIQDWLLKRETEYSKGIEERSTKLKTYEQQLAERDELQKVLAPYSQKWALNGWQTHERIQRLLAAQDMLDKTPAEGLRWLAEQYRLTPAQIFTAAQNQANGQQQQQIHPLIAAELAKLQKSQADIAREQAEWKAARENEQQAAVSNEIESFKADPANKHFEAVKARMSKLISEGDATTIKDAYEQAIWQEPSIRQQLLDEQIEARAKVAGNGQDPAEAAKAKARAEAAKRAKNAALSVTGAPSGGPSKHLPATLEEQIAANWA